MSAAMIGSLIWYYFPKYGGVHWFKGPMRTVVDELPDGKGDIDVVATEVSREEDEKMKQVSS